MPMGGTIVDVFSFFGSKFILVEVKSQENITRGTRSTTHMPIAIDFAPSRSKKIAVDVVPAEWQLYIAD